MSLTNRVLLAEKDLVVWPNAKQIPINTTQITKRIVALIMHGDLNGLHGIMSLR